MSDQPIKGMTASIYRTAAYNTRVLEGHDTALLVGDGVPPIISDGATPIFGPSTKWPILRYDPRDFRYRDKTHEIDVGFKPPIFVPVEAGDRWCAFTGLFVFSSDSRFRALSPSGGPIPVHTPVS